MYIYIYIYMYMKVVYGHMTNSQELQAELETLHSTSAEEKIELESQIAEITAQKARGDELDGLTDLSN